MTSRCKVTPAKLRDFAAALYGSLVGPGSHEFGRILFTWRLANRQHWRSGGGAESVVSQTIRAIEADSLGAQASVPTM